MADLNEPQKPAYLRNCNICQMFRDVAVPADYDARLPDGRWADVCEMHFRLYGCELGIGKGSKL